MALMLIFKPTATITARLLKANSQLKAKVIENDYRECMKAKEKAVAAVVIVLAVTRTTLLPTASSVYSVIG